MEPSKPKDEAPPPFNPEYELDTPDGYVNTDAFLRGNNASAPPTAGAPSLYAPPPAPYPPAQQAAAAAAQVQGNFYPSLQGYYSAPPQGAYPPQQGYPSSPPQQPQQQQQQQQQQRQQPPPSYSSSSSSSQPPYTYPPPTQTYAAPGLYAAAPPPGSGFPAGPPPPGSGFPPPAGGYPPSAVPTGGYPPAGAAPVSLAVAGAYPPGAYGYPQGTYLVAPPLVTMPAPMPMDAVAFERIRNYVFTGSNGKVKAFELHASGHLKQMWGNDLKGAGYHIVHLLLDIRTSKLFVGTNGHVYCFDAFSGKIAWMVKPEGQHGIVANDLMTIMLSRDGGLVFSACNGHVAALRITDGQAIWSRCISQPLGSRCGSLVMLEHRGVICVGVHGFVHALRIMDGVEIWCNELQGRGFNPISLAAYTFTAHGSFTYDTLFVGTSGYVAVLDLMTGQQRRQDVNLKGTGFKPSALLVDPAKDILFVATSGELNCFRASSMNIIWKSDLPGMGYAFGHSLMLQGDVLYIGMNGKLCAVAAHDGKTLWRINPPGSGMIFGTVGSTAHPNHLLFGAGGHLFIIDKSKGAILGHDNLKGMGYNPATVSSTTFNTDFNSCTLLQMIEMQRRNNNNT